MSNSSLLTVIVPTKNMHLKLELLKSWLCECEKYPIQVIIVVDFSSDGTFDEISSFVSMLGNSSIRIIHGNYGSPGLARNAGLKGINSNWLAFWDSDDYPILENVFEALHAKLMDTDIIIGGFITHEFDQPVISRTLSTNQETQNGTLEILRNPGIWRWIFRSSLVSDLEFPNLGLAEDQCYLASVLSKNPIILKSKKTFYDYSTNRYNSQTSTGRYIRDIKPAIQIIGREITRAPLKFKMVLLAAIIRLSFTYYKATWISRED